MKYANTNIDSLRNGEVKYDSEIIHSLFAVYESFDINNISKEDYDIVFIDEFHFLTDADR